MIMHYPPRVGILADDLTSAADGAGPFVGRGLSALVGRACLPTTNANVFAIDTRSRSLGVKAAVEVTQRFTASMKSAEILYKTVDSTLRGHVRAEIDAALKVSGRKKLVFAPAFPEAGRTTRNGIQLVDGVPVDQSRYARDPVHPATTSVLADFVPSDARSAFLLDAETQDDLDTQIAAISNPHDVLWVGSPGMAQALAARISSERPPVVPTTSRKVLVVVGSANAVSHEQCDLVEKVLGISVLRAPTARTQDSPGTLHKLVQAAISALETGDFGAVIATGGDTMEAILDGLGIHCFTLSGEFEAGFPVGLSSHGGRPLILGMKAGGFGTADTLANAAKHLTKFKEPTA
ncbi:four-carbon acid sugar kinase family protein [Qipengyuania citrea]|uniref:four-carbon acid sugar kinase family protein n=1 Tax=Qipengyuania citrea TaxID=225971 RepID=UPI00329837A4